MIVHTFFTSSCCNTLKHLPEQNSFSVAIIIIGNKTGYSNERGITRSHSGELALEEAMNLS